MYNPEKYFTANPPREHWDLPSPYAAVMPLYDEMEELPAALKTITAAMAAFPKPVTLIAVVNYPSGADGRQSEETRQWLRSRVSAVPGLKILWLPELEGGVGAARKIGMDSFLGNLDRRRLSESVICSLDGDTHLDRNYFNAVIPTTLIHRVTVMNFAHRRAGTAAAQSAITAYERYLRRYAEKLAEAGSSYGFWTLGSAFAVRGDTYLKAGGMKIRQAGEDFYFLQAAAKIHPVKIIREKLVFPSPRQSNRVPFGTGPAVSAAMQGKDFAEIPDSAFERLQELLARFAVIQAANRENFSNCLPEKTMDFLDREGFFQAWERFEKNQGKKGADCQKFLREWFDGLKTLRFLHFFQKNS